MHRCIDFWWNCIVRRMCGVNRTRRQKRHARSVEQVQAVYAPVHDAELLLCCMQSLTVATIHCIAYLNGDEGWRNE
jgi:hypothetical protein